MTIYHIGTEDIHFVQGAGAVISTDSTSFRSAWSRCSLVASSGTFWRAPLQHISVSTAEFWFTCRLIQNASAISFSDWLRFLDGDTWRLAVYGRQGQIPRLLRHNDDDTTTTLAIGSLPMFTLNVVGLVNIYVNLGTDTFRLYLDRELALNYTGDLTNSGEYSAITGFDLYGAGFLAAARYSEVCWRSDDTRKIIGVRAIWPYGDGTNMDWTGTIADVDEIAVDETDANYTDTVGLVQEYTIPPLPLLTGNVIIGGVMVGARMATNPTDEALVVRTGGADYLSSSQDTGGAIEDRMNIWETNPDTSVAFTQDEVDDPDFNIGVASA